MRTLGVRGAARRIDEPPVDHIYGQPRQEERVTTVCDMTIHELHELDLPDNFLKGLAGAYCGVCLATVCSRLPTAATSAVVSRGAGVRVRTLGEHKNATGGLL